MIRKKILFTGLFFMILTCSVYVFAEETGGDLEQGIWNYKHENYEEALELLKRARNADPKSSLAAYYLGISYKKLQDYSSAKPHLEAAASLTPKIKGALIELIDLLYKLGDLDDAKRWVEIAEDEGIRPAQTAFLKGLTLLKEGEDVDSAVSSLKNARDLDDTLAQVVNYHIGIAHLKTKNLKDARKIFSEMAKDDSAGDLALFANEYLNIINKRLEDQRPLKFRFSTFYQFDDNVTLRPDSGVLATRISKQEDSRMVYAGSTEYNLRLGKNFGTKFGHAFYIGDQFSLDSYDVFSNIYAVQPALYFKDFAITFPVTYNHLRVDNEDYLHTVSLANLNNVMLSPDHMLQGGFTYKKKDFRRNVGAVGENRDAIEYIWNIGHYYFFTKDKKGFLNIKYRMNIDDTKGRNWEYFGNRASASSTIPLHERVKLTLASSLFLQNFLNEHTTVRKERKDIIFQISSMVALEIFKGAEVQLQYTHINNKSNLAFYDYERNVYSAGVQFKF